MLPLQQPLAASPDACFWFSGRLDNGEEFAVSRPPDTPDISDASAAFAAYEHLGDRFVSRLNGDFALALVDHRRRTLTLARDVMASEPLYYCPLPGLVLFASEIKCLLAHPAVAAVPDEDGLAELVLDYWCDEHRTCFRGIYSVPPGHSIVADAAGIRRRTDWTFDPSRQIRYRSFDDYRDQFASIFDQAVRRRLRCKQSVGVAVSGGLDSSSIFCQALVACRAGSSRAKIRGISMTFPAGTPPDERSFLQEIERMHDVSVARVPVSEYSYVDYIGDAVRRLDTPGAAEGSALRVFETARRAGCDVLLSGFFGDQMLSNRGYLVDLAKQGRWLKIRHDLHEVAAWNTDVDPLLFRIETRRRFVRGLPPRWLFRLVKRLLSDPRLSARYPVWFAAAFRQRAAVRSSARFAEPRRFASAHAEQYYRHATAGHYRNIVRCERSAAAACGIDLRYPFRDRDLVAFLMAIPGEVVNWRGVPKALLRHAMDGILPPAVRDRRWKADFTALENSAMRRDAPHAVEWLNRDSLSVLAGFVEVSSVDRAASTFARMNDTEGASPGWRLTDLAGLELWLQHLQTFGSAHPR